MRFRDMLTVISLMFLPVLIVGAVQEMRYDYRIPTESLYGWDYFGKVEIPGSCAMTTGFGLEAKYLSQDRQIEVRYECLQRGKRVMHVLRYVAAERDGLTFDITNVLRVGTFRNGVHELTAVVVGMPGNEAWR